VTLSPERVWLRVRPRDYRFLAISIAVANGAVCCTYMFISSSLGELLMLVPNDAIAEVKTCSATRAGFESK